MNKKNKQILIIGIVIIGIILVGNFDLLSIFGQNPSGYLSYSFNSDGSLLIYSGIETRDYNFFEAKHIYLKNWGVNRDVVFPSNINQNTLTENYECRVYGTNVGWYEGEGASGSGNYDTKGIVKMDGNNPYCLIDLNEYNKVQSDINSQLYKSWFSLPGRIAGWQSTKITSGNVEFKLIPNISVFRLSNNQCSLVSIQESEKSLSDYDSLIECESKIIYENLTYNNTTCPMVTPPICKDNEVLVGKVDSKGCSYSICELIETPCLTVAGYIIQNNQCVYVNCGGKYNILQECEGNLTKKPSNSILYILGFITIIVFLVFIYLKIRKGR